MSRSKMRTWEALLFCLPVEVRSFFSFEASPDLAQREPRTLEREDDGPQDAGSGSELPRRGWPGLRAAVFGCSLNPGSLLGSRSTVPEFPRYEKCCISGTVGTQQLTKHDSCTGTVPDTS
jgi:hypothetical protein